MFFRQIKTEKIVFLLFCIKKIRKLFRPEKDSFKKLQKKNGNFQTGKSGFFVKKSKFLSSVFFGQIKTEKIVFLLFCIKKSFVEQKKEVLKNDKKSKFFKGVSPWFLSKNRPVYHLCFLGKSSKKRSFWSSG